MSRSGKPGASALLTAMLGLSAGEASARTETFTSGGVPITIERFDPSRSGRLPGVMLLHGSDGPGERYRIAARLIAGAGYPVFLLHYLDRTGERRASYGAIGGNLPLWTETARDGLNFIATQPGVDPNRIGVIGVSLGGGIGLALAGQDRRVRAFVDYFGFLPSSLAPAASLPPTLVLHGENDRVVPVDNARAIGNLLASRGAPHEVVIYPGQGHGFTGEAQIDAARRINAFFGQYLGGRASAR